LVCRQQNKHGSQPKGEGEKARNNGIQESPLEKKGNATYARLRAQKEPREAMLKQISTPKKEQQANS